MQWHSINLLHFIFNTLARLPKKERFATPGLSHAQIHGGGGGGLPPKFFINSYLLANVMIGIKIQNTLNQGVEPNLNRKPVQTAFYR